MQSDGRCQHFFGEHIADILEGQSQNREGDKSSDNCLKFMCLVFPVEPQSPNGKNINLHKMWGFRRFQKECRKVRTTALLA